MKLYVTITYTTGALGMLNDEERGTIRAVQGYESVYPYMDTQIISIC